MPQDTNKFIKSCSAVTKKKNSFYISVRARGISSFSWYSQADSQTE